jgi:hypothetical protein
MRRQRHGAGPSLRGARLSTCEGGSDMAMRCNAGRTGSNRVIRGGSWNSNARNVHAANRNANAPDNRNDDLGFRLAREQEWAGRPAPDPTCAASGLSGAGETQAGAGVEVAAAEAPANPHRWPTLSFRRRAL